jgi:hypothetical protein
VLALAGASGSCWLAAPDAVGIGSVERRPHPRCRLFRVPKEGCRLEECDDACAADPQQGRFAIADGATEGGQAGPWARMLVEEFVRRGDPLDWAGWLPGLQERWWTQVQTDPEASARPWFVDAQLEMGAFSTFLGLLLSPSGWLAQAVGDSCVFQVRGQCLLERFPVDQAAHFTTTPALLGSRPRTPVADASGSPLSLPAIETRQGSWQGGDRFWLMTDALAEWFLHQADQARAPWIMLESFLEQPDSAFVDQVSRLRAEGQLRNDDVTLVGVQL